MILLPADTPMWVIVLICVSVGTLAAVLAYWLVIGAEWVGRRREEKRLSGVADGQSEP